MLVLEVVKALATDLLLFAAVIVAFTQVARRADRLPVLHRQLLMGVVLGAAAVGAMMRPADLGPMRYVDARNVMLALSAPFAGLPGMIVTLVMTGAFRAYQQGAELTGLVSSAATALLGYAFTVHAARRGRAVRLGDLVLLAATAIPLGWVVYFTLGDADLGWFAVVALPGAIAKALGIPLLGAVLLGERDHHELQRRLVESERRYEAMAANVPGVVYRRVLNAAGQLSFEYVSPGLAELYGVSAERAMQDPRTVVDRIHPIDRVAFQSSVQASARTLGPWSLDYRVRHVDGGERWLRARATPRRRDNGDTVWDGVIVDITDQKDAEHGLRDANLVLQDEIAQRHVAEQQRDALIAELQRLSDTDPLTGVLNRRGFAAIVDRELKRLRRSGGSLAMILLDLDHFKRVNDRFGHEVGDLVLQRTAQACGATIREVDCVGRLGGEEFAILLQDADEQSAWLVAMRLRGELERLAIDVDGLPVPITASFGIVASDGAEASLPLMLRAADAALYKAKAAGRNRVVRSSRLAGASSKGADADISGTLGRSATSSQ